MILAGVWTLAPVRVLQCTSSGDLGPFGFVDVQPLIHQIDGSGVANPHGPIHGLPFFRLQGGANAVIVDPQAGDIGVMISASRDTSSLKATQQPGPPGSFRQYDPSDGFYFGGFLNGQPAQYLRFGQDGTVTLAATSKATIQAPALEVTGNATLDENLSVTGNADVQGNLTVDSCPTNTFQSADGKTITVTKGIITKIV